MDAYDIWEKTLAVGFAVAGIATCGSVIATFIMWCDYYKKKKAFTKEVEHMKEEIKACRQLLQKRNTPDG